MLSLFFFMYLLPAKELKCKSKISLSKKKFYKKEEFSTRSSVATSYALSFMYTTAAGQSLSTPTPLLAKEYLHVFVPHRSHYSLISSKRSCIQVNKREPFASSLQILLNIPYFGDVACQQFILFYRFVKVVEVKQ